MWWRVLAVILAFGLATILTIPSDRISDTSSRPVFIASLPCANRIQATSSGFVVDDETVITVAHALYESRDFAVRDGAGEWHDAVVRYIDLERDLAVLTVRGLRADPATTANARRGDRVRVLEGAASGTTAGTVLRPVRITTEVIGDLSQRTPRSGYELSTPIIGGDSGAGVVDDDGNLVAVIFAKSTRREAAWATSASEIEEVLQRQGGPTWECERPSSAQLQLVPLEEPKRLVN